MPDYFEKRLKKLFIAVWLSVFILWVEIKSLSGKIKRRAWNKGILLWWYRLWIRQDEFHPSLDMDPEAMMEISEEQRRKYLADLGRRRVIAHNLDLTRKDIKINEGGK